MSKKDDSLEPDKYGPPTIEKAVNYVLSLASSPVNVDITCEGPVDVTLRMRVVTKKADGKPGPASQFSAGSNGHKVQILTREFESLIGQDVTFYTEYDPWPNPDVPVSQSVVIHITA